jgi:hypothetical protein
VNYIFPKVEDFMHGLQWHYYVSNIHLKLRVDVGDDTVKGAFSSLGSDWATTGYEVTYPFVLKAKAPAEYFFVRDPF